MLFSFSAVADANEKLKMVEPKLNALNSTFLRIENVKTRLQFNIDKLKEQLKIAHGVANLVSWTIWSQTRTRPYPPQHQSRTGWQGQNIQQRDGWTDRRTDQPTDGLTD